MHRQFDPRIQRQELYELGSFYEIDHDKLPPKSPIQLKAIRVVMVAEATMLNVTVSFPSTLALRCYFTADHMVDFPELDERFLMSTNQAGGILRWRMASALLEAGTRRMSFWLLNPASLDTELALVESDKEDDHTKPVISIETCLQSLKCANVVGWGIRRKVRYIGRHCGSMTEQKLVQKGGGRKRTQEISKNHENKKTKKKKEVDGRESKKPKAEKAVKEKCTRGSKGRWSTERYEAAEKRLLEIMRAKKEELGTPVLRQALRDEARKHIGDTGLLDHLLKHMTGKIVSNGTERFRRRHNSEGAMEYWIEPAELVDIRRKAGVNDSFWVPPPGWKLSDSLFPSSCGSDCKLAIADLKQQVAAQLTRCDEQQNSLKKLEKETREINVESEKVIGAWQFIDSLTAQDKCQILLEQRTKQEEELVALFDYMRGIKRFRNRCKSVLSGSFIKLPVAYEKKNAMHVCCTVKQAEKPVQKPPFHQPGEAENMNSFRFLLKQVEKPNSFLFLLKQVENLDLLADDPPTENTDKTRDDKWRR
ncbi:hypothetical protein IEQ34_006573 [Dendrobium chrysotoxum]|uniref:PTC1-like winged helix-turn-helix domain-containing protein n=1 Tax=Dendrobium chrysotoxum TaxID=161865 RepID=A0AAV7H7A4_DENCH|nr:hypothetical protein IEQ34_006573 [Dendrobium chrysotoxum]